MLTHYIGQSPSSWPTWNLESRQPARNESTQLNLLLPPGPPPPGSSPAPLDFSPSPNGDPVGLHVLSPLQTTFPVISHQSPERNHDNISPPVSSPEATELPSVSNTNPLHVDIGDEWGPLYGEEEDLRRAIEMSMASAQQEEEEEVGLEVREGSLTTMNRSERQDRNHLHQQPHSGLTINGPQFMDFRDYENSEMALPRNRTSDFSRTEHEISLPPELRHLFATSNRTGAHV